MLGGALFAEPAIAKDRTGEARFSASYVSDIFANLDGGLDRGTAFLGKADLSMEISGDPIGIGGATAFVNVQYVHGRSLSGELVGDSQVVSNIEAVSALRPLEAWIAISLGNDVASIKAGLIDLNSEFDVQEVGAHFLNSSHGIGPDFSQSGLNGPSIFPTTATGAVVTYQGERGLTARLGVFDGVAGDPDQPRRTVVRFPGSTGALLVGEVDLSVAEVARVRVGGWTYTKRFEAIAEFEPDGSPRRLRSNKGAYAMVETRRSNSALDPAVDGWVRVGLADTRVNPIGAYVGGGLTYGTNERKWGLAISHARLGSPVRVRGIGPTTRYDSAETNVEISYSLAFNECMTIQPDIQYIINPGWVSGRANALVAGVRMHLKIL